jgi:hypothetical protein
MPRLQQPAKRTRKNETQNRVPLGVGFIPRQQRQKSPREGNRHACDGDPQVPAPRQEDPQDEPGKDDDGADKDYATKCRAAQGWDHRSFV